MLWQRFRRGIETVSKTRRVRGPVPVSYTHLKVYGDINAACYAGRAYEVVKEAVKQPGYAMWKEYCYPAILYEYLEYIIEDAVRDYNVLSME